MQQAFILQKKWNSRLTNRLFLKNQTKTKKLYNFKNIEDKNDC